MNNLISRKDFLNKGFLFSTGIALMPNLAFSQNKEKPAPIDPKIVNEFVKVAHSDFDKVKEMIKAQPLLLNASWDWGGGDFETALGAAGHMGLKDTANFLISLGARTDIFVLTMLGKTEIVKSLLKAYPNLLYSIGPHGFTLLHHAKKGGKEAEKLLKYIQKLGLKETFIPLK
ncbi:MAG: ankyrin repeat domain-containing protein [Alphaproteobacteria bacterium]|nr:ankyrin repeat domain-containing protein [Alphaproteobacteria bacterium]